VTRFVEVAADSCRAGAAGSVNAETQTGEISASAQASAGATPAAVASTSLNNVLTTMATAAYKQVGTIFCSDGCSAGSYTKQTGKKTVSVAREDDAFSLAVASKKSAYAKSAAINHALALRRGLRARQPEIRKGCRCRQRLQPRIHQ
jgi:hypothetical protein